MYWKWVNARSEKYLEPNDPLSIIMVPLQSFPHPDSNAVYLVHAWNTLQRVDNFNKTQANTLIILFVFAWVLLKLATRM